MSNVVYEYLWCRSCGKKQYIGANVHEGSSLPTDQHKGAANSLEIALKFIVLHGGHKISLWTTDDFNQSPSVLPEEWPYSEEHNEMLVPTWDEIVPLRESPEERRVQQELIELKYAYEQMYCAFMDLRIRTEPDAHEKNALADQLRGWMEEHNYGHCGPHAVPEVSDLAPAIPPPRQAAVQIAQTIAGFEE